MAHPYIYPSRTLVFNLINEDNGTFFNPTDVSLQNIRPDTTGGELRNTAIDIVGNVAEGIEGSVTVFYRRINIAEAFMRCDVEIKWQGESDTLGVIQAVNKLYGTKFDATDIELEAFNPNVLPVDVTVRIKDTSLAWIGSLKVRVAPFAQSLRDGMQIVVDPVFDYPTKQSVKAQGPLYLMPYSFDNYWTFLRGLTVGLQSSQDSQSLRTLINAVLPAANQWTLSAAPAVRNLGYSEGRVQILYSGAPIAKYTHRLSVGRILVVALSDTMCTDVYGYLVMHFSNPALDLDSWMVNKDIGKVGL